MARPRLLKACHVTIQKLLYLYVIVAAGSRGVYYTTEVCFLPLVTSFNGRGSSVHYCINASSFGEKLQANLTLLLFKFQLTLPQQWRVDLFAVYYPFVICSFTAVICFWAEVRKKWKFSLWISSPFLIFLKFCSYHYPLPPPTSSCISCPSPDYYLTCHFIPPLISLTLPCTLFITYPPCPLSLQLLFVLPPSPITWFSPCIVFSRTTFVLYLAPPQDDHLISPLVPSTALRPALPPIPFLFCVPSCPPCSSPYLSLYSVPSHLHPGCPSLTLQSFCSILNPSILTSLSVAPFFTVCPAPVSHSLPHV